MIKIRKETKADTKDVQHIKTVVTRELRSIYQPIRKKHYKDQTIPIHLVATVNNNLIGSAEYLLYKNSVLIQGLAILPAYRNQGIATKIIDYITIQVKTEGKHELLLSTVKETGNTDIFLKMGFTALSEEESDIFESPQGDKITIINMHKALIDY